MAKNAIIYLLYADIYDDVMLDIYLFDYPRHPGSSSSTGQPEMLTFSCLSFLLLLLSAITSRTSADGGHPVRKISPSPFNGKDLVFSALDGAIDFRTVRNSTGHIVRLAGVSADIIPWLSAFYNFSYTINLFNTPPLDTVGNRTGLITYLSRGDCDLLANVSPTRARVLLVDFTHPSIYLPVTFAIPPPRSASNVAAIVQPFTKWVWTLVLISYLLVYSVLYAFIWYFSGKKEFKSFLYAILFKPIELLGDDRKENPVRLIICAWLLGVFMIFNYYTSLLTSFATAPNPQPLIRSVYELSNRPDIRIAVDKGRNMAATLLSAESGFAKELGDRLRADPESLCTRCVDMLKSGRKTVYIGGREGSLIAAMYMDFQLTGKCNVELSKEYFMHLQLNWAVQKDSPFLAPVNRGFMLMREAGLIPLWYKRNTPDVSQCLRDKSGSMDGLDSGDPLTLKDMSGIFFFMLIGYGGSLIIFIIEFLAANFSP